MSTSPTPVTSNPQPVTSTPEPAARVPVPEKRPQCRAITTDGTRCRAYALKGIHLCHSHFHHRFPALPDADHISIPLLEDPASVQLLMTQIAHGLLSMKLDPLRARTTIWAAQVAASTFPRPARLKPQDPPPPGDPVFRIGFDHEGFISVDGLREENAETSVHPANAESCTTDPVPEEGPCNLDAVPPDPEPSEELNYLCTIPTTPDEIWALQDQVHSINQPAPEHRFTDPQHPAPPPKPFPGWDAPHPIPSPPPCAHESGLPCDCPTCVARHAALVQEHIDRYNGRARRKPKTEDNPLCPSNKPDCLGSSSEFCCRSCRKLRIPPPEFDDDPADQPDHDSAPEAPCPEPEEGSSAPCTLSAERCAGVIPPAQYPGIVDE